MDVKLSKVLVLLLALTVMPAHAVETLRISISQGFQPVLESLKPRLSQQLGMNIEVVPRPNLVLYNDFNKKTVNSDVVIFGHTHMFEQDYKNKTLFVNPGEVCAREKPFIECVQLEIKENEYIISRYFKKINEKNFKKEEYIYER